MGSLQEKHYSTVTVAPQQQHTKPAALPGAVCFLWSAGLRGQKGQGQIGGPTQHQQIFSCRPALSDLKGLASKYQKDCSICSLKRVKFLNIQLEITDHFRHSVIGICETKITNEIETFHNIAGYNMYSK